jgi:hypothetical protein
VPGIGRCWSSVSISSSVSSSSSSSDDRSESESKSSSDDDFGSCLRTTLLLILWTASCSAPNSSSACAGKLAIFLCRLDILLHVSYVS